MYKAVAMVLNRPHNELTAAGLSGTFTRFPFHPQHRDAEQTALAEQNVAKLRFSFKPPHLFTKKLHLHGANDRNE